MNARIRQIRDSLRQSIPAGETLIASSMSGSLVIRIELIELVMMSSGTLNPWFAPAIRGMVLKPLRDHFCEMLGGKRCAKPSLSSPVIDGRTAVLGTSTSDKQYCVGCVKNGICEYGRVFEPDLNILMPGQSIAGASQGLRAITFATPVLGRPTRESVDLVDKTPGSRTSHRHSQIISHDRREKITVAVGSRLPLRLLAVGQNAIDLLPTVVEGLAIIGYSSGLWSDPPVTFAIATPHLSSETFDLDPKSLPVQLGSEIVPELRVNFDTPISLKRTKQEQRHFPRPESPTIDFAELLSLSVRTVRRAIHEYADRSFYHQHHLGGFLSEARNVRSVSHNLTFFSQTRSSRRQLDQHDQTGWLGSICFQNVPTCYLPWLEWAGRLGVGDSRNCGTGLFYVESNPTT